MPVKAFMYGVIVFFFSMLLIACTGTHDYAPVSVAWQMQPVKRGFYRVRPGDTLYAVAWRYDMDYRDLAKINHLSAPYHLTAGQQLRIKPVRVKQNSKPKAPVLVKPKPNLKKQPPIAIIKPLETTKPHKIVSSKKQKNSYDGLRWSWPTQGKVVKNYSKSTRSKGIDIAGQLGQPIYAAAPGQVAYSGHGLRGYGNLLIIKHNDEYLSAYAHNSQLLVKEGMNVKAGQQIAKMGQSDATRPILHFEIRKAGKPVDPMIYLR